VNLPTTRDAEKNGFDQRIGADQLTDLKPDTLISGNFRQPASRRSVRTSLPRRGSAMLTRRLTSSLLVLGTALTLTTVGRAVEPRKFFPASTEIVVTVNFRQMLDSDLLKGKKEAVALAKTMLEGAIQEKSAEGHKYFKELSFDPVRDLDRLTVVSGATTDPAKVLVILSGRFDTKKFTAAAERAARDHGDNLKISRAGKHQVVEVTLPDEKNNFCVTLVDNQTLLLSQGRATLTEALARAGKEEPAKLKEEVKDLLASRPKKSSLSFVATGNAVGKLLAASNDPRIAAAGPVLDKLLDKVIGFNGSVTLGNDVNFQLGVGAKDAQTAKDFAQQAMFGLILLRGTVAQKAKDNPQLAPILDVVKTLRASSQGNTFLIRGQVPAAVLGRALKEAFNHYQESQSK
jgi:hypothetical protein